MSTQITVSGNVPLDQVSKESLCAIIAQDSVRIAQNNARIDQLTAENVALRLRNKELEDDKKLLSDIIKNNEIEIADLKTQIKNLEADIIDLKRERDESRKERDESRKERDESRKERDESRKERDESRKERDTFRDLVILCEISTKLNQKFKAAYKKEFKPKRKDCIPNMGNYIEDPPEKGDNDYKFWEEFKATFPGTTDDKFRSFYSRLSKRRAKNGAHIDISTENFEIARKNLFVTETDDEKAVLDHSRTILPLLLA